MAGFKTFRTEGLIDAQLARTKTIILVGLGSLGSEVAVQFAFEWRKLILVDPSSLNVENIERHHLGISSLGKNKAQAMKEYLVREKGLPPESIEAYSELSSSVLPNIKNADLLICSIDDQPSCRGINEWCVANNVPAVYGGIYPKGFGGDTIALPKPQEVCYLCAENSRNALETIVPEHSGNYGINPELINKVDERPTAVPALRNSIYAIAVDVVSRAWDILFPVGELFPILQYRSINNWVEVAQVTKGTELEAIAKFIGVRRGLLLATDLISLGPPDKDGWQRLAIRHIVWPKLISQWTRCPMHGPVHNISEL